MSKNLNNNTIYKPSSSRSSIRSINTPRNRKSSDNTIEYNNNIIIDSDNEYIYGNNKSISPTTKLITISNSNELAPVKLIQLERPQSRKLYLGSPGSLSDPRPALRVPKSAGSRIKLSDSIISNQISSDMITIDIPNDIKIKKMNSFSEFSRIDTYDSVIDIPDQRPPSRQRSAFPIHLADEPKSRDSEASLDTIINKNLNNEQSINVSIDNSNNIIDDDDNIIDLNSLPTSPIEKVKYTRHNRSFTNGSNQERNLLESSLSIENISTDQSLKRPPSRQKLAAQNLFDGFRPKTTIDKDRIQTASATIKQSNDLLDKPMNDYPITAPTGRNNRMNRVASKGTSIVHDPIADGFINNDELYPIKVEINYSYDISSNSTKSRTMTRPYTTSNPIYSKRNNNWANGENNNNSDRNITSASNKKSNWKGLEAKFKDVKISDQSDWTIASDNNRINKPQPPSTAPANLINESWDDELDNESVYLSEDSGEFDSTIRNSLLESSLGQDFLSLFAPGP